MSFAVVADGVAGASGSPEDTTGQAWAAPEWTYSPDEPIPDGDIAARARGESVALAEAERRLRADRAAAQVDGIARARWPETYAGLWIDHHPYRVTVAFTADAASKVDELRTDFPYPDDLHSATRSHTLDALVRLQGVLADERTAVQQRRAPADMPSAIVATGGAYDLAVDISAGHVVVRAARPGADVASAFARRYSGPVVVTGGVSRPRTCTIADCRHAMMGGLRLEIPGQGYCSSAFPAYLTSNSSYRYVLSAGHCYTQTQESRRDNGNETYGHTTAAKVAYEVDAERIRRTDDVWRESSKFLVQGESYPRSVNSVTAFTAIQEGAYIGKTGATTGTTRGYVEHKIAAPHYVPNARNFVEADMCSDEGDSGAAVWSGTSAYGILSGGPIASCRNINGTLITHPSPTAGPTHFGALSYATRALAVTLLTGVNLKPTAEFTYSCLLLECTFDGTASTDDDGGITSWTWDFGDGSTGSGRTTSHSYLLPGLYTAKLTTKDNNGASTSKTVGITVTAS